jgi:hypothetical protein
MAIGPMLSRRDDPLPLDAVRDLLGLVRSIYAAERARGAGRLELERVRRAGRLLADALDLGAAHAPGTVGHFAAWRKAEEGARAACELVDHRLGAERIVEAARGRVGKSTAGAR